MKEKYRQNVPSHTLLQNEIRAISIREKTQKRRRQKRGNLSYLLVMMILSLEIMLQANLSRCNIPIDEGVS